MNLVYADQDALYVEEFTYHADDIEPQIACPHQVDNVKPVGEVEGTHIDQVFIGTCTNGRLEDLEVVATILKGKEDCSQDYCNSCIPHYPPCSNRKRDYRNSAESRRDSCNSWMWTLSWCPSRSTWGRRSLHFNSKSKFQR